MGRLVIFGFANFTPGQSGINYFKMIYEYLKRPKYDPLEMVSINKSIMCFNLIWLWQELEILQ